MSAYSGEYEDILQPFLDAMRYKLHVNRHKGVNWSQNSIEDLFKRLRGEVDELEEAIKQGNTVEMLLESADVANYACILSHLAIKSAVAGKGSDKATWGKTPTTIENVCSCKTEADCYGGSTLTNIECAVEKGKRMLSENVNARHVKQGTL